MLHHLIGDLKIHKKSLLLCVLCLAGGYTLGVLVLSIIAWTDKTAAHWFCAGTLGALFALVMATLLLFLNFRQDFDLALSLGQTRRGFLLTYALRLLLWTVGGFLMILLLYKLEPLYYGILFPRLTPAFSIDFLFSWQLVLPLLAGLVVLSMFLGAMHARFGKPFTTVLYFVWIGSCILLPRVINHWEQWTHTPIGKILGVFARIPTGAWIGIGIAGAAALVLATVRLSLRHSIR